jgi:predicted DsbA family dithiol-disulfide isomerase
MPQRWSIAGFIVAVALASAGSIAAQAPSADEAVAKINGRTVTRAELYEKQATTILQQRYDAYRAERETLGQLIDNQLLETEARRRSLTTQKLLEQEIDAKVKDPTDAELQVFYEGAQTDQPFESLRAQLLARVRQSRTKKAREAFLGNLRSEAKIQILLPPPFTEVTVDDAPARGPKNAAVAFVEFADFECPFCRQMQPEIEKLLQEYNGRVVLFYKDFPLSIHPHAQKASEAARCAGQQNAYWPYHDILFREGSSLEVPQLKQYARALRLDTARFDTCLHSGAQAAAIQKDLAQGEHIGVSGTPGFFINGHFISGVVSYETLREVVEQQLNTRPASSK